MKAENFPNRIWAIWQQKKLKEEGKDSSDVVSEV